MGVKLGKPARGKRRAHGVMAEINVTPMVDVMLVLLVIFMVTAPLLSAGVTIDLPKSRASVLSQQDNTPVEINVDAQGNIFMGDTPVKPSRLHGILEAIAQQNPERRVYVRADQRLSYGQVMNVMTMVSTSGLTKIALITDSQAAQQKP
jgi:biopolymer transport protein TolR